jgi:hypothetical protein
MSNTVELPGSAMRVQFRVIFKTTNGRESQLMLSTPSYLAAEEMCWRCNGEYYDEAHIEKVWILK